MPRKGPAIKRQPVPDPIYGSELMTRFINRMMLDGKKVTAEKIFYGAMAICEQKAGVPAVEVFAHAGKAGVPAVEVRPRRVGGRTYQVPMEVRPDRRRTLALRWMINASRKRAGKTMVEKLANEVMDAYNGTGSTIKKREDTHRMADANKAFAHYRF